MEHEAIGGGRGAPNFGAEIGFPGEGKGRQGRSGGEYGSGIVNRLRKGKMLPKRGGCPGGKMQQWQLSFLLYSTIGEKLVRTRGVQGLQEARKDKNRVCYQEGVRVTGGKGKRMGSST